MKPDGPETVASPPLSDVHCSSFSSEDLTPPEASILPPRRRSAVEDMITTGQEGAGGVGSPSTGEKEALYCILLGRSSEAPVSIDRS